jgi:uncharacterized membrane protein
VRLVRGPGFLRRLVGRIRSLVAAIEAGDEARIEDAIVGLSRSRRALAPLAFTVSAFVLLFDGLRLLLGNWRLTLIQVVPAMWIWLAMFDLKAHLLRRNTLPSLEGPLLIPIGVAIVAMTAASFYLNAVFAFAIDKPGEARIRPGFAQARRHLRPIVISGATVGVLLALAVTVAARRGHPWFVLSLGAVVGIMMVGYVAVPARLIGRKAELSRRDRMSTAAVAGVLGATVCTPPYLLGRIGILMLATKALLIPGIILLAVGATLQAGATGAVRAIKMSVKLGAVRRSASPVADSDRPPAA